MNRKICLFIGSHRPSSPRRDSGEDLIKKLFALDGYQTDVYLSPEDRLGKKYLSRRSGVGEIRPIPAILRQPRKAILNCLSSDKERPLWEEWLQGFAARNYYLGIVYFGSWMPPQLFSLPEMGFINFHPGPLPGLRGFEAETWAILTGMQSFYGTIHRLSEEYDEGEILWKTPLVRIRGRETPASLLWRTCHAGIVSLERFLRTLQRNGLPPSTVQKKEEGIFASLRRIERFSQVCWAEDSLHMLDRKNRAFNGQYVPVEFTFEWKNECRIISDLLAVPGRYLGGLGAYCGIYQGAGKFRGCPMFQALDGVVVFRLMPSGSNKPDRATVFSGYADDETQGAYRGIGRT